MGASQQQTMADLYATSFDYMDINQMRSACDALDITWSFANSTTILRGRINRKLKERGQSSAKCLNDVWPSAPSNGYQVIESRMNAGKVLTLIGGQVELRAKAGASGSQYQQWRMSNGTTGSLLCKADLGGRLIMSGTAVDDRHEITYGSTSINQSATWVFDASTQAYALREPWAYRGNSFTLALTADYAGNVHGSKFFHFAKASQMWTPTTAAPNYAKPGPALSRTYTNMFGRSEPMASNAKATKWQLGRSTSDPQQLASLISLTAYNERKIKEAFNTLDTDGNGELTGKDFDNRNQSEKTRRSRHAQWVQIREYMDVDGNGRIDQAEFRVGCLRTAIEQTASGGGMFGGIFGGGGGTTAQNLKRLQTEVNSSITQIVNAVTRKYRAAPY